MGATAVAKRGRTVQQKKAAVCEALRKTGNLSRAVQLAGIGRQTHYDWRRADPEYAVAVEDAITEAADVLEQEARRRAFTGVKKPVFQGGKLVGHVQEYSDTLLIFLLKGAKPEKYRDRHELTGKDGEPLQAGVVVVPATARDLEEWQQRHSKTLPS